MVQLSSQYGIRHFLTTNIMKKIFKIASIVTSGIIVGALVRKFAFQGFSTRGSSIDSVKSVKNLFNTSEEADNYFV